MSKFIKLYVLDTQKADHDYVAYIHPQSVLRVDTATPVERLDRKEVNSVIMCTTGKFWLTENAAQFIARVEAAIDEAESSIPK